MIKLQAIGFLGKDAITNNVNGKTVINFSVAHTEKYKDAAGNQQSKTIWVECSWWTDKTAIVPYLLKGTQVYVEGQPEVRQWTGQDGKPGANLSLRVQNVQLLGSPQGQQGGGQAQPAGAVADYRSPAGASYQAPTGPVEDLLSNHLAVPGEAWGPYQNHHYERNRITLKGLVLGRIEPRDQDRGIRGRLPVPGRRDRIIKS